MVQPARPEVLALLTECKGGNDFSRLLLADLLTDSADPADRACGEFVRLQCRLKQLAAQDPERPALEAYLAQLLDAHEIDWLAPLLEVDLLSSWRWRCGLLQVTIDKGRALSRAARTLEGSEAVAWIEGVRLEQLSRPGVLVRSLESPVLDGATALDLGGVPVPVQDLEELAASSTLRRLRWLDLSGGDGSEPAQTERRLYLLAGSDHLSGLTFLGLRRVHRTHGRDDFEELACCRSLTALEEIDLSDSSFGTEGLLSLARSPILHRLTRVRQRNDDFWNYASGHGWDDEAYRPTVAWAELGRTPGLARWRLLDLSDNGHAGGHLVHLTASPFVQDLTHLSLAGWESRPRGVWNILAESPSLNSLIELNLERTSLTVDEQQRLRHRYGSAIRF